MPKWKQSGRKDAVQKNNIRVVIDTNIWISFLIGKTLSGLSEAIMNDKVRKPRGVTLRQRADGSDKSVKGEHHD